MAVSTAPQSATLGPLRMIPRHRVALLDGAPVHLSRTEYDVLYALAKRRGEVVSIYDLEAAAWVPNHFSRATIVQSGRWGNGVTGTHLSHAIRVNISRLRRRLGAHAWLIQAVPGFGYRIDLESIRARAGAS